MSAASHSDLGGGSNDLQRDQWMCSVDGVGWWDPHTFTPAYRDVLIAGDISESTATQCLCDAMANNDRAPSSQDRAVAVQRERLAVRSSLSESGWANTGTDDNGHGPGPCFTNAAMLSGTEQSGHFQSACTSSRTMAEPNHLLQGQGNSLAEVAGTGV